MRTRDTSIETVADALRVVRRDADPDGSPVTIEAGVWFVCFVPGITRQWWHPLVHKTHKHVFAMRPEPDGRWTLFEPWWHRLLSTSLSVEQARKFLVWAAAGEVVAVREHIPGRGSQIRGWMTCAGLVSYLLGRPYWVWTPHRFYTLLQREMNVWRVDPLALLDLDATQLSAVAMAIAAASDDVLPDTAGDGDADAPAWTAWFRPNSGGDRLATPN
ncbi:MAG TPA: hypothetical protein VG871_22340 [Vicinamibacterales bacterium]|nr:hypothetical protein [Vicinamibacterales bacterium]